jgi:hypothetical protein
MKRRSQKRCLRMRGANNNNKKKTLNYCPQMRDKTLRNAADDQMTMKGVESDGVKGISRTRKKSERRNMFSINFPLFIEYGSASFS